MTTRREQIMQAISAALATTPGINGRVFRSREAALSREEAPALVLRWVGELPEGETTHRVQKRLSVLVDVYQRAAIPDQAADPIVEAVHGLLMAEPPLGGLALDIEEAGTEVEMDEADITACFVSMRFIVKYRHLRGSLAA